MTFAKPAHTKDSQESLDCLELSGLTKYRESWVSYLGVLGLCKVIPIRKIGTLNVKRKAPAGHKSTRANSENCRWKTTNRTKSLQTGRGSYAIPLLVAVYASLPSSNNQETFIIEDISRGKCHDKCLVPAYFPYCVWLKSLGYMLKVILVSPAGVSISIICQHRSVCLYVLLYVAETGSPVQSFKPCIQIKILRCICFLSLELRIALHVPKFPGRFEDSKERAPPTSTDLVSHFHSAPAAWKKNGKDKQISKRVK